MRKLPPSGTHGRPWSAARRGLARLAAWVQARRQGRRPLMTVTAADLMVAWGLGKNLIVSLRVDGLAVWKFQSFQLRYYRVSVPGVWFDAGTRTDFAAPSLSWSFMVVAEGEDYFFELTATESCGVVTVTADTVNIGFS